MTPRRLSPLICPEFDEFLGAPISENRNGTTLSALSALLRSSMSSFADDDSIWAKERRDSGQNDLFRARLDQVVDLDRAVAKLGRSID
jgi:hypothetical protein